MSFFTNPFASNTPIPIFTSSPLNPLPASGFPTLPTSLKRASLVRRGSGGGPSSPVSCEAPVNSGGVGSLGVGLGGSASAGPSQASSREGGGVGGGVPILGFAGGVNFVSPFAQKTTSPASGVNRSSRRMSTQSTTSTGSPSSSRGNSHVRSHKRSASEDRSTPGSPQGQGLVGQATAAAAAAAASGVRRGSLPTTPSPIRSPSAIPISSPFFSSGGVVNHVYCSPNSSVPSAGGFLGQQNHNVDFSRRRSVDVGVLRLGTHRHAGIGSVSKRVRDAVGPDAGDKETGLVGAGLKGNKDRLLGRHLASLLAHSLALCAEPATPSETLASSASLSLATPSLPLSAIPGSPSTSPVPSRNTSLSGSTTFSLTGSVSSSSPPCDVPYLSPSRLASSAPPIPAFPALSEAKRFRLIGNLQSWSFNAMGYTPDELLSCVGIIFEGVRNMEGVSFDFERMKALLVSLQSAYHTRNGYHNFSHAADVTQACYSFLVRMGLAPPLYLLCEDDYDANLGEGRRKWRRNRAVEEGGMGELLRPMDCFALMVAAIGHDVGHPGLSNAYMVNARTPVAQVYEDKSVLENFHTVTLIHMLRKHGFDDLLGGGFGHLGDQATSFRKVLEACILATDMSRHFDFVNQITDLGRRFGERRGPANNNSVADDRLLLCSGLIKCADISNPTRPHRISRAWSTALLNEWTVQAAIETEFGLPISVMTLDPNDTKAQAKSQVGFIDLFAKPLFNAMAGVVDEFADFAEKLRDGRIAWEAISLQTDLAFCQPISKEWKWSPSPAAGRHLLKKDGISGEDEDVAGTNQADTTDLEHSTLTVVDESSPTPVQASVATLSSITGQLSSTPAPVPRVRRPLVLHPTSHINFHHRQMSDGSSSSAMSASPLSPAFPASVCSSTTNGTSAFSVGSAPLIDSHMIFPSNRYPLNELLIEKSTCGGVCQTATATCETCSKAHDAVRRGSLGRALASIEGVEEEEEEIDLRFEDRDPTVWPPYPFQPTIGC